ncbi:SDR family NAD(P)-dependent oxidoreductase [Chenggangzhangella methanolivorans]|uniref:SDR family oxidoreductase n=1 Tax=Chenggangzhangella methanolivorans TaxID=1437009 RepID=A0A9E6UP19_9HYPH|nr:SDR family oxidoreductase [Chenggangzhangella methanolivorans]QZO01771.1 SDR family oxidoreductase [Chenggangzhangella methanolivorans]
MAVSTLGVALITGASGGIGAMYADRLARRGYDLILVARNEERLEEVATRARNVGGNVVETIAADLNSATDLRMLEARLRDDASVSVLVNNAGFGSASPLLQSNVDDMERMIGVNITALTRLTYAAAPAFVARGGGSIINISSTVAIGLEVLNGVYGASKAYVLALTQSLDHELASKGLRVQAVLPGATATDFWKVAGVGGHQNLPAEIVMRADALVDAALMGFDAGEVVTIPLLQDAGEWDAYDDARKALAGHLGGSLPAPRYLVQTSVAA